MNELRERYTWLEEKFGSQKMMELIDYLKRNEACIPEGEYKTIRGLIPFAGFITGIDIEPQPGFRYYAPDDPQAMYHELDFGDIWIGLGPAEQVLMIGNRYSCEPCVQTPFGASAGRSGTDETMY